MPKQVQTFASYLINPQNISIKSFKISTKVAKFRQIWSHWCWLKKGFVAFVPDGALDADVHPSTPGQVDVEKIPHGAGSEKLSEMDE